MSDHLHTVTITGTEDHPRIEFACVGGRDAECHHYPDCDCETWDRDNPCHSFGPHDDCWMKSSFDNADADTCPLDPMPETLTDYDIKVGDSGPISTWFNGESIDWDFEEVSSDGE